MSNTALTFSDRPKDRSRSYEAKIEAIYRKSVRREKYQTSKMSR